MSLQEKILSDLTAAMKAQEADRVSVLRMIKAALLHEMKSAASNSSAMPDEAVIAVLAREAKKRKEAAQAFTQGNREDLAQKELAELALIDAYLPAQASDDDIRAAVQEVVSALGANAQFGAVMGMAMKKLQGTADGSRVKAIVEEIVKQQS